MPSSPISRRSVLCGGALAAPMVWTGRAFGAEQIVAADVGGAPGAAIRKAFYDPFEKETGIRVAGVAHDSDPTTQFKLLVDTKSYIWDVCSVTPADLLQLRGSKSYADTLNIAPGELASVVPGMVTPDWAGFDIWATILGYRTDKFSDGKGPTTWSDFWDVKRFPGRRGMYKGSSGMLEVALLADGVPPEKLYPLDVDRAFRALDRIKPFVSVWWTTGAQNTQILQNGEVAMSPVWGARAYAAIEGGAPLKLSWSQGLYSSDGWAIPKGTPRVDLARKFVRFCLRPEQQAILSNIVANAPTNTEAYKFIKPERASLMATSPENFNSLKRTNEEWWGQYRERVEERFQDWLLS